MMKMNTTTTTTNNIYGTHRSHAIAVTHTYEILCTSNHCKNIIWTRAFCPFISARSFFLALAPIRSAKIVKIILLRVFCCCCCRRCLLVEFFVSMCFFRVFFIFFYCWLGSASPNQNITLHHSHTRSFLPYPSPVFHVWICSSRKRDTFFSHTIFILRVISAYCLSLKCYDCIRKLCTVLLVHKVYFFSIPSPLSYSVFGFSLGIQKP